MYWATRSGLNESSARANELELAFVMRDVARRINAGQVCFQPVVHLDGVFLELEAPAGQRPQIGFEADQGNDGVDVEMGILVCPIIKDRHTGHAHIAVDIAHFLVRQHFDLATFHRFTQQFHRVRVRAEPVAAVNQNQALGFSLEIQHPVDSRIATTHNQHLFAVVFGRILDVICHTLA